MGFLDERGIFENRTVSFSSNYDLYRLNDQNNSGIIKFLPISKNPQKGFEPVAVHYIPSSKRYFYCPARTNYIRGVEDSDQCLICSNLVGKDEEIVRQLKPKDRAVFYILDLVEIQQSQELKVKMLSLPAFNAKLLFEVIEGREDVFQEENSPMIKVDFERNERGIPIYIFTVEDATFSISDVDGLSDAIKDTWFEINDVYPKAEQDDILSIPELSGEEAEADTFNYKRAPAGVSTKPNPTKTGSSQTTQTNNNSGMGKVDDFKKRIEELRKKKGT